MGAELDIGSLDDAALEQLQQEVAAERYRRWVIASAPQRLDEILATVHEARGGDGMQWEAPVDATHCYPAGAVVTHQGPYWRSTHPANSWEPGTPNAQWEQVWTDGAGGWTTTPPDTGPREWRSGIRVTANIDEVTCDGWIWRAKITHDTHEGWRPGPATYAIWEKVREI